MLFLCVHPCGCMQVKASGSSSSGSNDISNKAFPPDDDQVIWLFKLLLHVYGFLCTCMSVLIWHPSKVVEEISFETVEVVGWSKGCLL